MTIGSFNQNNAGESFGIAGADGNGTLASLTIGDVANSNVNSSNFFIGNGTGLRLNSVTTAGEFFVEGGAGTVEILQDLQVGKTRIGGGMQVVVGGAFNQNNAGESFTIAGIGGNGTFATLSVGDVAASNVTCSDFYIGNETSLSLNSVTTAGRVLRRRGCGYRRDTPRPAGWKDSYWRWNASRCWRCI